jgi:glycosyltransferase involved in cell wall biosynthesis
MKILRVISSMDPRTGGPCEGIRQITQVLDAEGHSTEVACLDAPDHPWVRESPMPIHALGPPTGRYYYSGRLVPWLRSHAGHFDCTIVHGVWQYQGLGVWMVLRRTDQPYFLYSHGMLDPWFRRAYPLKHLKKVLYWRLAEHRILHDASAVLFTSEEEQLLARQSFRPFRCNGVVVNYGTRGPVGDPEVQRREFLARYPELSGKRLLLSMGRIHLKKGCDLLIEAFADAARSDPELHLVMAGPDQTGWKGELQQLAEARGVGPRITWTGMLSGDLKWGALRASDAFILPSHAENFGIVVAEALACGLPTLISNKVNIWREVQADGAGFVGNDDLPGTNAILRRWLDCTAEERQAMRQSALRCFDTRFHIQRAASSLIQTLRRHGVGNQRE